MKIIDQPSPNHDTRGGAAVELLLLHYTGMPTGAEALERLCDASSKVSAHYLVEEDGRVFQLVDEEARAWHAGVASWRGQTDMNARSIGIEIVNPGHEWGYRPFPEVQMQAVVSLCQDILARHPAIAPRNVVGHSDVAPARKQDPGELFPWEWLAEQSIGLWPTVDGYPLSVDRSSVNGQRSTVNLNKLERYGYGIDLATQEELILAFQRHFRPEKVNGLWDGDCAARLEWLLAQAPSC